MEAFAKNAPIYPDCLFRCVFTVSLAPLKRSRRVGNRGID